MFFGRFTSSIGYVGIDFGTRGIKMLQVREAAGKLHVVGAARIDVPLIKPQAATTNQSSAQSKYGEPPIPLATNTIDNAALAERIRDAFANGGFTGRKCVVSLAREDVSLQSVRLPRMSDEEMRQTVCWESAQRFGLAKNSMEADFIRTGATLSTGENRDEVILIGASHAAIHARLEPVLAAGLRPVAVDTTFAALVRTFSRRVRRESDRDLVRVVVEIGASGSTVLILRGDQIAFCKPLSISCQMFTRAVAEHLQMNERDAGELRQQRCQLAMNAAAGSPATLLDPATDRAIFDAVRPVMNELAKEITLCLRYYTVTFRGHPPERLILTGGESLEPHLAETISKVCKIQVTFDDAPSDLTALSGEIQSLLNRSPGPAGCWAAAMGLSLRGIKSQKSDSRDAPGAATSEARESSAAEPATAGAGRATA